MDAVESIRLALAHGGEGAACYCINVALAAAHDAAMKALKDNTRLPAADQVALALQAVDEAIEELAIELSEVQRVEG